MGDDRGLSRRFVEESHVNRVAIAPQAEQRPMTRGELIREPAPEIKIDYAARPRPMIDDGLAVGERVGERRHA
jgi:hypothetical protein